MIRREAVRDDNASLCLVWCIQHRLRLTFSGIVVMVPCVTVSRKKMTKLSMPAPSSLDSLVSRERWYLIRTELIWAYRGIPTQQNCEHWVHVPHISAWLILRGEASVQTPETVCKATAGEWLIAPPGKRLQKITPDCEILSICFVWQWIHGRDLLSVPDGLIIPSKEAPALESLGFQLAARAQRGVLSIVLDRIDTIPAHLEVQASFSVWLAKLVHEMHHRGITPRLTPLDPRVEETVQILACPGMGFPRPAELARRVGLSQSQLNRLFLRNLEMSVVSYCDQQKLAAAQGLLGTSAHSVKEIAYQLGFVSPQHFSRWFREHSGVSPSRLIKHRAIMI